MHSSVEDVSLKDIPVTLAARPVRFLAARGSIQLAVIIRILESGANSFFRAAHNAHAPFLRAETSIIMSDDCEEIGNIILVHFFVVTGGKRVVQPPSRHVWGQASNVLVY